MKNPLDKISNRLHIAEESTNETEDLTTEMIPNEMQNKQQMYVFHKASLISYQNLTSVALGRVSELI